MYRKLLSVLLTIGIVLSLIPAFVAQSETTAGDKTETEIFYNGNAYGVQSDPTKPTTFTVDKEYMITFIMDYHYFNNGVLPGTIALKHSDGTIYGPWQTKGREGQGSVNNAYWDAVPNVQIKAGTYTVIDSDPSTWSQNTQSDNIGMTLVKGYAVILAPTTETATPTAAPTAAPASVQSGIDLTGEWDISAGNINPSKMYITSQTGNEFTGTAFSGKSLSGTISGNTATFNVIWDSTNTLNFWTLPGSIDFITKIGGNFCTNGMHPIYGWYATKATSSVAPTAPPTAVPTNTNDKTETEIFYNGNAYGVQSDPTKPTTFTVDKAYMITFIMDYHYFNNGVLPGTIALKHSDSTIYGPWQTKGREGQGSVNNAYWDAVPNVQIKAGTYTVIDSDPSTWSQNTQSDNIGMTLIKGYATEAAQINVLLNGNKLNFDVPPQIINDRTMVPLRKIFEALGAEVIWIDATKTIIGKKGTTIVILTIDSTNATVNNVPKTLDVPATIVDDRTMVPARFISESLGCKVEWDDASNTVLITTN